MNLGISTIIEVIFRVMLGLRFLNSGISNVIRWPNAAKTASLVFPQGATFFGLIATCLMVLGGSGLAAGFQTHLAGLMIVIFLIPTLQVHRYWLHALPTTVRTLGCTLTGEHAKSELQLLSRHAIHGHETGWQNNIILLLAALFFTVRGSVAFGLDNVYAQWVIRLF